MTRRHPARGLITAACLTIAAALTAGVAPATSAADGSPTASAAATPAATADAAARSVHDEGSGKYTPGQRSGLEPDGMVYEKPTHKPETRRPFDNRPNVVLITTDDQALTDLRWMPRTRRWLAGEGIRFTNMISPHPLCCPARAEILTGQYAQNNGVHTNAGPYGGLDALRGADNTIATWLQDSGYLAGMTGKYLNQYNATVGVPSGWDFWNVATTNGFGYSRFPMYHNGEPKFYGPDSHSSDVIAADTVQMVRDWSAADQPFFIWASYYAPHGICGSDEGCANPPEPARRHRGLHRDAAAPSMAKPSYNEADVRDKPGVIRRLGKIGRAKALHLHRERIRALAAVDEGVDATFRALQATGELDDTVVLFTSDNGYLIGEHRYRGKVLPYEEALRVPLLARGPGLPAGETRTQVATTVDLAPTILELADVQPGRVLDGRSLVPFLLDGDLPRYDDTILVQAGGLADRSPTPWMFRGVRDTRYTFVRWSNGFRELYDNRRDPHQLRNVGSDRRYRNVVREMSRRLAVLKDCRGASCRATFGRSPAPRG
ncbi:sulfatase family protein [Nocardioides sp. SYSU DS0663]|uniref:sulfatase family protein n=1 Tax=Nocardioides sp. SYSU DS0663 TaxID=3416445 RepID=UPI003F4B5AA3